MDDPKYVALRAMKVQELNPDGSNKLGDDGRPVTRKVGPGDPVPEANGWRGLAREISRGRIGIAGVPLTGRALGDALRRNQFKGADQRSSVPAAPERKRVRRADDPKPAAAAEESAPKSAGE